MCLYPCIQACTAMPQQSVSGAQIFHISRAFQLSFQFQAVLVGRFLFVEAGPVARSCLSGAQWP